MPTPDNAPGRRRRRWIFRGLFLSGLVVLYALLMGGADTGWTFYTPLSTAYANGYVFAAAMAVFR